MVSQSIIFGKIDGISKNDFNKLKKDLQECFEKVGWEENVLIVKSEGTHTRIKDLFNKIAECISEGKFGSLLYVGNDKVACFYFGHNKFAAKQYREPNPPDWWGIQEETA